MRYRGTSASTDDAAARMARYIRNPVADSCCSPPWLPAMAIQRFGLMPPLALPHSVLLAAARHILETGHGNAAGGHGRHR
ncbi:MAG: hypothetical protein H0X64_11455 [Gemmatimonadaceae bacterium]|nr:hypothetical protein [Gemmatimonadaceae bacterium]